MAAHPQNLIGPQLRKLRTEAGMSQETLAAKCQRLGWDASRDIIKHIESGVRRVCDAELVILANVLDIEWEALMPIKREVLRIALGALR